MREEVTMTAREMNTNCVGPMKVIGFEEHYGLSAIYEAAVKANDPYAQVMETMRKSGRFAADSKNRVSCGHL
jgi:hypothetical protein